MDVYSLDEITNSSYWEGIEDLDSIYKINVSNPHIFLNPVEFGPHPNFRGYGIPEDDFAEENNSAIRPIIESRTNGMLTLPMADNDIDFYLANFETLPIYGFPNRLNLYVFCGLNKNGELVPKETLYIKLKSDKREVIINVIDIDEDVLLDKNGEPETYETEDGDVLNIPRIIYHVKPLYGNKFERDDNPTQEIIQFIIDYGYKFKAEFNDYGETVITINDEKGFNFSLLHLKGRFIVDPKGYFVRFQFDWEHGYNNAPWEEILHLINYRNEHDENLLCYCLTDDDKVIRIQSTQFTKDGFGRDTIDSVFHYSMLGFGYLVMNMRVKFKTKD